MAIMCDLICVQQRTHLILGELTKYFYFCVHWYLITGDMLVSFTVTPLFTMKLL